MFRYSRFLVLAAAAGLVLLASPVACAPADRGQPSRQVARQSSELFDTLSRMELSAAPELVTRLGLPKGQLSVRENAVFGDKSQAAFERLRLRRIEALKLLEALPLAPEGSALRGHQEVVLRVYDDAVRIGEFGHGRVALGDAYPYVMDHRSGVWVDLPNLLSRRQRIASREDAEAYLSRLVALASAVDDARLRLVADAESGVVPPLFILEEMSARLARDLVVPIEQDRLVIAFENQLTGLSEADGQVVQSLREDALLAMQTRIRPAYTRLAEAVEHLKETASEVPGVWALPDGDAYYDAVLAMHVRPGITAESLHREGRAEVEALDARLSTALAALEPQAGNAADRAPASVVEGAADRLPAPSVAEQLAALSQRPDQVFEATPEGRAAILTEINRTLNLARRDMAAWVARMPDLPVRAAIASADAHLPASALYTPPAPDGSAPGLFRVNLQQPELWPRYKIPALVFHETVPGHHTEASFAMEVAGLPRIRQLMWVTGYGEGWATYAETLALEAGVYAEDPLVEIGILHSQMFSAARMVADTGLHRMRWSREEAVEYLVASAGLPQAAAEAEINRLVVWPGQAAAYTGGAQQIRALRARAEAVLGPRFDAAAFHYTLLAGGPRPLAQLESDMERWYEAQMTE
ncbi:MAG: DUF885 family protein [Hyphomonadaceae bacterium]|nr:DUF885 family protein [Hyphomonadaceae bacterium]